MLRECGIIREKHCRASEILKKGEGKLVYTDGISSKLLFSSSISILGKKSKSGYLRSPIG